MARVTLIGVPSNSSGVSGGCARGPSALRETGLVEALGRACDIEDLGDVALPEPSSIRDPATHVIDPAGLGAKVRAAEAAVRDVLTRGRFPLIIGGDCPLLLGCVAGSGARGVLFTDGHEDAYPPAVSPTGEAADMELGFLLGLAPAPDGVPCPVLDASAVAILGARDGPLLRREGVASLRGRVHLLDDAELATDPEEMTERALESVGVPWWFHLDLDVLSTEALPAVDYPQPGGIGWLDLLSVTRVALGAGPLGWDVTIYNPDLDPDRTSAQRIVRFLADAVRLVPG